MVDVFSNNIFSGNAATVFLCDKPLESYLYQKIALEFYQGESVFIEPTSENKTHFKAAVFTPHEESHIPEYSLLAAAQVLWEEKKVSLEDPIYFETKSKIQKITYHDNLLHITLPKKSATPTISPDRLFNALGTLPVSVYQCKKDLIVELHEEEEIHYLVPDFSKLSTIEYDRIILTCEKQNENYDYIARVFAPKIGHDEEAPNVHAHCSLGAFWSLQLDKNNLIGKHIGTREGDIFLTIDQDHIHLATHAIISAQGTLNIKS